jgi:hypothetical protein
MAVRSLREAVLGFSHDFDRLELFEGAEKSMGRSAEVL